MPPSRSSQIAKGCPLSTMWTMAPLDHEQLHGDPAGRRSKFGRRSLRQFVASLGPPSPLSQIANAGACPTVGQAPLSHRATTAPRITRPPGLRGYPRAMLANPATAYVGICRIRTSAHAWKGTWVNSKQSRCNAAACDTQPAGVNEARVKPEKTARRSMARNWH